MKVKGTVKWFDIKKGFGFITDEDGIDYFVHFSEIMGGNEFKKLKSGQTVLFEAAEDDRGRSIAKEVEVQEES